MGRPFPSVTSITLVPLPRLVLPTDELREKLSDLKDIRTAAERELEEVQGRAERITDLERDRDALLATYEALAPEELDDLTHEERHDFYRTLRVVVYAHPEGSVEVTGEYLPFDGPAIRQTIRLVCRLAATGPDQSPTAPTLLLEGSPQI